MQCHNISSFVWRFTSQSRMFHSFGDVVITGVGLPIFTFTWHAWPLSNEGSMNVPHLLWHGPTLYIGHLRGPMTQRERDREREKQKDRQKNTDRDRHRERDIYQYTVYRIIFCVHFLLFIIEICSLDSFFITSLKWHICNLYKSLSIGLAEKYIFVKSLLIFYTMLGYILMISWLIDFLLAWFEHLHNNLMLYIYINEKKWQITQRDRFVQFDKNTAKRTHHREITVLAK